MQPNDPRVATAGRLRTARQRTPRMAVAVHVRAAGPDDAPAVLAMWARARSQNASTPDTAEAVDRLLATDPGALLVAERDGALVGALIAAWDGWRGNMYRLAVDAGHRRLGV